MYREWGVLVTGEGYSRYHGGRELGALVELALQEFYEWQEHRDAVEWARDAIPDKPPKLRAPGTADEQRQPGRDVG